MNWEAVIGVEIHVRLKTQHKLFCGNRVVFGGEPNAHVCSVCMGLPGALPVLNPEAVELALRTALALECTVHLESVWARKTYFYPDLPKGYQITQFEQPLATEGKIDFSGSEGDAFVCIRRVHMEEDAGKLLHDKVPGATAIDLNRAGTALVEIVTEPDFRTPGDVRSFLGELKRTLEYVGASDCNMEQGGLRVDANVSVRKTGSSGLGNKTEIKNVNSFSGVERALSLEIARQISTVEAGNVVRQQTLLWDDHRAELREMRSKEESHDYRYFPEPDLPPLRISQEQVTVVLNSLPELPRDRRCRFEEVYKLTEYDAEVLTQSAATADYFEEVVGIVIDPKVAAKWVTGPLQALMNQLGEDAQTVPVRPEKMAALIGLVETGAVSESAAKSVLVILAEEDGSPSDIIEARGLFQERDVHRISTWVGEVLATHSEEVDRYRAGESKILGYLVGRVMHSSGGAADPRIVRKLLIERLKN
ncbi:MAG TPA: Asp-tRNA(Asn)/Glu-tRNA(Gln) amidotransferase subunit GatB [Gemmatimonadetes bacterium]|nr:Asp-tRNA(Asn)/Glu-tRNA(Gln) amidotransferase subunit GatB [Gemmatimonadota bacterium]